MPLDERVRACSHPCELVLNDRYIWRSDWDTGAPLCLPLRQKREGVPRQPPEKTVRQLHPKRVENPEAKCPRHPKKEPRKLVDGAWERGAFCEWGRDAIYCYPPDGVTASVRVSIGPQTPQDLRNLKARFARAGLSM